LNFGLGKEGEGPDLGAGRGESSGGRMGRFRFTLDGCCDPSGSNSHVERFCSFVDSVLERDLRGEALWANPDYSDGRFVGRILRHFLEAYADVDYVTSGTFTLPAWVWALWWRLLRGGHVLAYYPPKSALFTSPDWRRLEKVGGDYAFDDQIARCYRGPTRWGVIIVHFPPLLAHRLAGQASGHVRPRGTLRAFGSAGGGERLPVLRGEGAADLRLLSEMPQSSVR
jgi:hypothetical protein